MKKEFIFLIDVNLNNFPRDLFKVSSNLNKLNNQFSFICIYDDYESKDLIEKITRQFPKNYLFIRSKPNAKFIQQLFEEYKPVASINMAHRIFDMTYNFFSKEYKVPIFSIQHALYKGWEKKLWSFYIINFYKSIRYFKYIFIIALNFKRNLFQNFNYLFNNYVFGKTLVNTKFNLKKITADWVCIYGNYWKNYYKKLYEYLDQQFYIFGTPDLVLTNNIDKKIKNSVLYISQPLVADGLLKKKDFLTFLNNLEALCNDKKLFIKLHQRDNFDLYKDVLKKNKPNISLTNKFLNCEYYIGHFSSLLCAPIFLKKKVFLFKFLKHDEYPLFLTKFGYYSGSYTMLKRFLRDDLKNNISYSDRKNFFEYKKHSYWCVANFIFNKIKNKIDN